MEKVLVVGKKGGVFGWVVKTLRLVTLWIWENLITIAIKVRLTQIL